MAESALLTCPVRGRLLVREKAKDSLTYSEEKRRIDAIRFLLARGYPKSHFKIEPTVLRFGASGRNSFRADFAVLDVPASRVAKLAPEKMIEHLKLVAEVKRSNKDSDSAKANQVRPALALLPQDDAVAVYWDDLEQRLFHKIRRGNSWSIVEAPLSTIAPWGSSGTRAQICYGDLLPAGDLVKLFDALEDILHPHVPDKAKRYEVLLQLLVTKLHDETVHRARPDQALALQDLSASAITDDEALSSLTGCLQQGARHYEKYLPQPVKATFSVPVAPLRECTRLLAPISVLTAQGSVIQTFYMKFAKSLYKWDLAQYFTPTEVIDFIVDVVQPLQGEHTIDPACGSGDFLVSTLRKTSSEYIWGRDNSEQAIQVAVLNMVLHGNGKTNIKQKDSLQSQKDGGEHFPVVLCNPPFGVKIQERRQAVLKKFDLAHEWKPSVRGVDKSSALQVSQQTGILFAELCVKLAAPGGRIGIILPNGYLGNRQGDYLALREWILRHTRVVAVVGFPRFTFKKSGADVSASALFLERREQPLSGSLSSDDYPIFFGMIESVGWRVGDKSSLPVYLRDQSNGSIVYDESNRPILDADFSSVLRELLLSPTAAHFPWLLQGRDQIDGPQTESVWVSEILLDSSRPLDPKRFCSKVRGLVRSIKAGDHFTLSSVLRPVSRGRFTKKADREYRFVRIENIGIGSCEFEPLRGWQLPDRARLTASEGDFFIASIWSSAGKWFRALGEQSDVVVTNGCSQFELIPGCEDYLMDVLVGFCSEAFRVQMRAYATGSDGLAEISEASILQIVFPRILDPKRRAELKKIADLFAVGQEPVYRLVGSHLSKLGEDWPEPPPRKGHWGLV